MRKTIIQAHTFVKKLRARRITKRNYNIIKPSHIDVRRSYDLKMMDLKLINNKDEKNDKENLNSSKIIYQKLIEMDFDEL